MNAPLRIAPRRALAAACAALLAACGGSGGTAGDDGQTTLLSITAEPAGAHCAAGGQRVDVGLDADRDGALDQAEVSKTVYLCDGAAGVTPTPQPEDPGAHCPAGGVKLEVPDQAPTYLCNGTAGEGGATGGDGADGQSVEISIVPDGSEECPHGGVRLQVGEGAARFVCNGGDGADGEDGADGADAPAVSITDAGRNCAHGGLAIQVGSGTIQYVCDGAGGADGQSVTVTPDAGELCEFGGAVLQVGEGQATTVCNGAPGQDGRSVTIEEDVFGLCQHGGYLLAIGKDDPVPVCNGAPGQDAVCSGNRAPVIHGVEVPEGAVYSGESPIVSVNAGDLDGDLLTFSISGAGGTFQDLGGGAFSFHPAQPGGPYNFSVIATDGCRLALGSFTIESVRQGWTAAGDAGFIDGSYDHSMAVLDGVPYVAGVGRTTSVLEVSRLDAAGWVDVSPAGAGTANVGYSTSLAVHGGSLHLAAAKGKFYRLDGSSWTSLAAYSDGLNIRTVRLFSDGEDLYVGYLHNEDGNASNQRIGVKRWDGAAWTPVGYSGADGLGVWAFGFYPAFELFVDAGTPYVLFTDQINGTDGSYGRFSVMRYDGSAWTMVGARRVADAHYRNHLAVVDGQVFVALRTVGGTPGGIWRFDGTSWQQANGAGLTAGEEPALTVSGGRLYALLAKTPNTPNYVMQLHVWQGDHWEKVGNDGLSRVGDWGAALAEDGGTFWVTYSEPYLADDPFSAMKLETGGTGGSGGAGIPGG